MLAAGKSDAGKMVVLAATAKGNSIQSSKRMLCMARVFAPNQRWRGSHTGRTVSRSASPWPANQPAHPLVSRSSATESSSAIASTISTSGSGAISGIRLAGWSSSQRKEYGASVSEYGTR